MLLIERLFILASLGTFVGTSILAIYASIKSNNNKKEAKEALQKALNSKSIPQLENVLVLYSSVLDKDMIEKIRRRINELVLEEDF